MPLSAYVQARLHHAKFVTPTPVQVESIPLALEGKDILATAQTGTGKTLAFIVPIIEKLLAEKHAEKSPYHSDEKKHTHEKPHAEKHSHKEDKGRREKHPAADVFALILVPTRELAIQVEAQYELMRGRELPHAAVVVGGLSEKAQLDDIRDGARVIVATPGRLEDYLDRKLVKLAHLKVVVLDEADRMLDMGFIPAIRRIMAQVPKKRQTMCFSATLDPSVVHLMGDYLHNPVRLAFGSTSKPIDTVKLQVFEVSTNQKAALLKKLLSEEKGRCLVFARTKRGADRLAKTLARDGFSATAIHGDRSQSQRNAALAGFQKGKHQVLVATDVAARGIHVEEIAQVINYDLPNIAEDFVHRVGRTGRAGSSGVASTFVAPQDWPDFKALERTLNLKMERMSVDGELAAEERNKPVEIKAGAKMRTVPNSKMVIMPGESLRRYGGQ